MKYKKLHEKIKKMALEVHKEFHPIEHKTFEHKVLEKRPTPKKQFVINDKLKSLFKKLNSTHFLGEFKKELAHSVYEQYPELTTEEKKNLISQKMKQFITEYKEQVSAGKLTFTDLPVKQKAKILSRLTGGALVLGTVSFLLIKLFNCKPKFKESSKEVNEVVHEALSDSQEPISEKVNNLSSDDPEIQKSLDDLKSLLSLPPTVNINTKEDASKVIELTRQVKQKTNEIKNLNIDDNTKNTISEIEQIINSI